MHKSRRGRDPSEAIHTRGVEDHPTKITSGGDARDCIRYNGDRLTNPHKSGRDSTHHQGDRPTTTHGARDCTSHSRPQPTYHGHANTAHELQMAVSPLAGAPQARHLTIGSCDSQVSQIVCWQTQSIHSELESADQGPVGLTDSDRGLSHPPLISSQTRDHTSQPSLFIREPDLAAGGDTNLAGETSHRSSPTPDNGLLLQHVYGTQERWWSETSYQPKKAQQPCEVRALQNGEPSHSEIPSS